MRDDLPSPWDWADEEEPPEELSEVLQGAAELVDCSQIDDAITLLDEAIQRGRDSGDWDTEAVVVLYLTKATRLAEASRFENVLETCEQAIDYASGDSTAWSHFAALAMILHALALEELGRAPESMVELDEVAETFRNEEDPKLRVAAASALRYRTRQLAETRSLEEAEGALAILIDRYGNDPASAVRAEVALGMAEIAICLIQANRRRRASRLVSQILARYEGSKDPDIRAALAVAYVSKLHILPRHGRLVAYFRCVKAFYRFIGKDPEPKVVEAVRSHHPKGDKLLGDAATLNS